jgi:glycerate 2-kinase
MGEICGRKTKRLLLASDSFKGTLSGKEINEIAEETIEAHFKGLWSLEALLLGDGGEGSLKAISSYLKGEKHFFATLSSEMAPLIAPIFISEGTAYIETAKVIGLPQAKSTLRPMERSSKGIGILIKEALKLGAKRILLCLGGSSTSDLGIGMLSELGISFSGIANPTMADAYDIKSIDLSGFLLRSTPIEFSCLCDVNNPLLGANGASRVYGPQKGFTDCDDLEERAKRIALLYQSATGKDLSLPFLGAAGGLASALYAFMDATLLSGAKTILKLAHFEEKAAEADLVISGEGRFDGQSKQGKLVGEIASIIPKGKLALIVGQSKCEKEEFPIYEIGKERHSLEEMKAKAREGYAKALRQALSHF